LNNEVRSRRAGQLAVGIGAKEAGQFLSMVLEKAELPICYKIHGNKNLFLGIIDGITAWLYDINDIDWYRTYEETGEDHDWRWSQQWLPHTAWWL